MTAQFKPFQTLAGSSYGGVSPLQAASELLSCCIDAGMTNGKQADIENTLDQCDDTNAERPEEADEIIESLIDKLISFLNDSTALPASCSVQWEDNEVRVIPYIIDDYPQIEAGHEIFYELNDHGNVACFQWNGEAYRKIWDMV